jgi:hypothetical protein
MAPLSSAPAANPSFSPAKNAPVKRLAEPRDGPWMSIKSG